MDKSFPQAQVDRRIRRNFWLILIVTSLFAFLVVSSLDGTERLIFSTLIYGRVVLWAWAWHKHTASGYEIDDAVLRIARPWPFKTITLPLEDISRIRYGDLESTTYVIGSECGRSLQPWMYIRKARIIPLHEPHKLDYTKLNSLNCLFWVAGWLGYYAYPPLKSDIRVRSFVVDKDRMVFLEGPTNYLISPESPWEFVKRLRLAKAGQQ